MGFSTAALGLGLVRLLAALPPSLGIAVGRLIGIFLYYKATNRRLICARNINLCFPNLNEQQQNMLVKQSFQQNGIGLVETAWAWHKPTNFIHNRYCVKGAEYLQQASGKGILLLCPHYSMLDLVAPLIHAVSGSFIISYRPNDSKLFDKAVRRGRGRYAKLVDVRALRNITKYLKDGEIVWFGPDQDMGPNGSVFASFFGRLACTVTTPARLTRISGAKAIFLDLYRDKSGIYQMQFIPMSDDYPKEDEEENARELNQKIEKALRKNPSQYMWMHKRFKTNPDLTRQTLYQFD